MHETHIIAPCEYRMHHSICLHWTRKSTWSHESVRVAARCDRQPAQLAMHASSPTVPNAPMRTEHAAEQTHMPSNERPSVRQAERERAGSLTASLCICTVERSDTQALAPEVGRSPLG